MIDRIMNLGSKKVKYIRVSLFGHSGSGKNHFLYQFLKEFDHKLGRDSVLTLRNIPDRIDNKIYLYKSAEVFVNYNKEALINTGIPSTDSTNDDGALFAEDRIVIYEAKYKNYIFQFLNAPGGFYQNAEIMSELNKVRKDYFKTIVAQGTTNEEREIINRLMEIPDVGAREARQIYFTYLFNLNTDFVFQLSDEDDMNVEVFSNTKDAKILSKFDKYVNFDGTKYQDNSLGYRQMYRRKCEDLFKCWSNTSEFETYGPVIPQIRNLKSKKDPEKGVLYSNIIPTVFFVFQDNDKIRVLNKPHYVPKTESNGYRVSTEAQDKIPKSRFPNLYRGEELGKGFENKRLALGYDIALYFMLTSLGIGYGKVNTTGTIGRHVEFWEDYFDAFEKN